MKPALNHGNEDLNVNEVITMFFYITIKSSHKHTYHIHTIITWYSCLALFPFSLYKQQVAASLT